MTAAREGFSRYVERHSRALLHTAFRLTGNRLHAEDLVQTTLAETWEHWDDIRSKAALEGYVRRTMANTHTSWWRIRRVQEYLTDDLPEQLWEDPGPDQIDLRQTILKALDVLSTRQREVVMLRYYHDLSETQAATMLGVKTGTVKTIASRALATLRTNDDLRQAWTATRRPRRRNNEPANTSPIHDHRRCGEAGKSVTGRLSA
jgi:RNA polymerase sigma-70 factor (sigma-E family)